MKCSGNNISRFAKSTALLAEHRKHWETKPAIRIVYQDYHRRLMAAMPGGLSGPILDLGGGSGHLKESFPDVLVLDILSSPQVNIVGDAHRLPFAESSLRGIVMLDVMHHLERPRIFLAEAGRVLRPGGRLAMIEPAMTPLAWLCFNFLHQEPIDMAADPLNDNRAEPGRDPFESNQAIPWLLFYRQRGVRRFMITFPEFTLRERVLLSVVAYPLSGGFKPWSIITENAARMLLRMEDLLLPLAGPGMAFRLMAVLEKTPVTGRNRA